MTENKLIYDQRERLNQIIDDSEISDRYIMFLYDIKRAKYLRRDLNDLQKTVDNSIIQEFCLEMQEASINDCGIDYDCGTIMKSVQPIPKPLELHLKSAITKVKPTNKIALPFNFLDKSRAITSNYSSFPNSIYAFLDTDLHIYLVSTSPLVKMIECLTVAGIFESPSDLQNYKNCCGCDNITCYDSNLTDYPLQGHHIDMISEEIFQTLVNKLKVQEDQINNSNDN